MNKDQQEQLDRYLNDQMSATERESFEAKLKADPHLAKEAAFQQSVAKTVVFKQLIGNAFEDFEQKGLHRALRSAHKKNSSPSYRRKLYAAAAIGLLLILSILFWISIRSSQPALMALDFEKIALPAQSRSGNATMDEGIELAVTSIQQARYTEAEEYLEQVKKGDAYFYLSQLYLAFVQYQLEEYQLALDLAQKLAQNESLSPPFRNRADWIRIKCLLAQDRKTEARNFLDQLLQTPGHVFYEEALMLREACCS